MINLNNAQVPELIARGVSEKISKLIINERTQNGNYLNRGEFAKRLLDKIKTENIEVQTSTKDILKNYMFNEFIETMNSYTFEPTLSLGFLSFDGVSHSLVSKSDLVSAIIENLESAHWIWGDMANGNRITEKSTEMFKYIVAYTTSVIVRGSNITALETENLLTELLMRDDLSISSNFTDTAKELANNNKHLITKIKRSLSLSKKYSEGVNAPWSAVFIVWAVRTSCFQLGLEWDNQNKVHNQGSVLELGTSHSKYGLPAYNRKKNNELGCYHAVKPENKILELGDIIVSDRKANRTLNSRLVYSGLSTQPGYTHGDIIIEVNREEGWVITIGGNVKDSVRKRRYPITEAGIIKIDDLKQPLYTQEKDGVLAFCDETKTSTILDSRSTSRIFAIHTLVPTTGLK